MRPSLRSRHDPPGAAGATDSRCGDGNIPVPTVVLLHGWGSHAARFADFVAPLRAAGFAVIGIDAPAHGTSPGRFSDLPRFRDSLAEVLRAHEPIHAVIGHSLGGGAVLTVLAETADHHPKKICLFGVPSDMDYILESFAMMLGLKPPAVDNLRARFITKFGRPARAVSVTAAAPSVRIPVLVVHDEDDNVAPIAQGAALAGRHSGRHSLAHARVRSQRCAARPGDHSAGHRVPQKLVKKLTRKNNSGPPVSRLKSNGWSVSKTTRLVSSMV